MLFYVELRQAHSNEYPDLPHPLRRLLHRLYRLRGIGGGEDMKLKAAVHSARFDNTGACKLTLEIDGSQAIHAAALAVQVQQLFDVTFELEGESEP